MASKRITPTQVIRAKCLDCSAGSAKEVRLCPVVDCPLWEWRFGKRPKTVAAKSPHPLDRSLFRSPILAISDEDDGATPEPQAEDGDAESRASSTFLTPDASDDGGAHSMEGSI